MGVGFPLRILGGMATGALLRHRQHLGFGEADRVQQTPGGGIAQGFGTGLATVKGRAQVFLVAIHAVQGGVRPEDVDIRRSTGAMALGAGGYGFFCEGGGCE